MRIGRGLASPESASLAVVALAGGLCLAMPFLSDQALFTLYARQLTQGAVLYRDLFDIKQPGIFMFYTVGGLLFGFDEVGIHLFELLYWAAFSLFAFVALPRYFATRWGAPLVPVLTVAVYYLYAEVPDLTQIEILVSFPLLVAWWLIDRADPRTRTGLRRYAAAGLATAAVVLLKHLYLLIVLGFLAYAVRRSWRRNASPADIGRGLGAFAIALVVPLAVVLTYFAAHGQLERIWWVYFDFVPHSQLRGTKSFDDLKFGARRFMIGHAAVLILAVVGCVHGLREHRRRRLELAAGMMLWAAAGAVALSVQGWWDYKWLLFTFPTGLLAVAGLEALLAVRGFPTRAVVLAGATLLAVITCLIAAHLPRLQTGLLLSIVVGGGSGIAADVFASDARVRRHLSYAIAASVAVSVGLMAAGPLHKAGVLMAHDFGLTAADRAEFQRSTSTAYRTADRDVQALRARPVLAGPVHVFVDPVLMFRANGRPAIPFLGQDLHSYDARAWMEIDRDLRSALPAYIVVDEAGGSIIRSRKPSILELIDSRYQVAFAGAMGTWYVLRNTRSQS